MDDSGTVSPVVEMATTSKSGPLVVDEAASLEQVRDDWHRLAEVDTDLFRSYEWAQAWEAAAGAHRRLLLRFAEADGTVVGIARLTRLRSVPVRLYGFEGQGWANQVGPVCEPRHRAAVADALRAVISPRRSRPGILLARGLMHEDGWSGLLGGEVVKRLPSPVLRLGEQDWEQWLAARSKNFRQQVGKLERRLERAHGLEYHQVTDPAALGGAFEEMFALHDARWQGGSTYFAPLGRAVHGAFGRIALERGWLRLWRADLDGRPAAYWLGYFYGGDYWSFQVARDPAYAEQSIGLVVLTHAVRCAFAERATRFRHLSGTQEYKLRFANEDAGHETVLVTSRYLAPPGRVAFAAGLKAPAPVRAQLERRLHL